MELELTDLEARQLIEVFKNIIKKHSNVLIQSPASKGSIDITSFADKREFRLSYYFSINKTQINFMDVLTKYTLFRVNLDNNFHKNASGDIIRGNRINIFSEDEFHSKKDGFTHYRAYALPYEDIDNTSDFFEMLNQIFQFANINNQSLVSITENINLL